MLLSLTIKNFGLIDSVILDFTKGLNILTGETGAGKSILIDALRSVLGERIDPASIRDPKSQLFIEAVIDVSDKNLTSNPIIAEFITDDDSQLIIQRTLSADSKSKIKINGQTVTVSQLKTVGNHLIDFHGPHDHQMLLDDRQHLVMLDQLIDFKDLKKIYTETYQKYSSLNQQLEKLTLLAQTQAREVDFLTHQVKELESLTLTQEQYDKLIQDQTKIANAQKLHEHIQTALLMLNDDESGINDRLRKTFASLRNITSIDTHAQEFLNSLTNIQEMTTDLSAQLEDYAQSLDFDADSAEKVSEQCDAYREILKKYGPTMADAAKRFEESRSKLDLILNVSNHDSALRTEILGIEKSLSLIANKITKLRLKAGSSIKETIETQLRELGIPNVQFAVKIEQTPLSKSGQDNLCFYISPNAGEDLKPLADIVSSGEAARVMLALKKALIHVDPIPVLIFDEIDAQIGGRLGNITGKKLKELSRERQVILITHLPQIASFADKHFKVIKTVKSGRALTTVVTLEHDEQLREIATMMSGQDTGKVALSHAKEMLETAQRSR